MPLSQGKSKKSFEKNIKTEMQHGKPQGQALAISYSIKRKNSHKKAKMADGGNVAATTVRPDAGFGKVIVKDAHKGGKMSRYAEGGMAYKNDSAASESRPMPEEMDNDRMQAQHNRAKKQLIGSGWADNPTVSQAQKPSPTKLSRPKMVGSDAFSVRDRDEVDADEQRMTKIPPAGPKEQPSSRMDEEGPKRQGPKVSDMQKEHSTHEEPYRLEEEHEYAQDERDMRLAEGGMIDPEDDRNMRLDDEYGGAIEEDQAPDMSPEDGDDTEMRPPGHEYLSGQEEMLFEGGEVHDDEAAALGRTLADNEEHVEINPDGSVKKPVPMKKARGGMINDMDEQPESEEEEERHNSLVAAIMAKRDREQAGSDSGSPDEERAERAMYARGGAILEGGGPINSHGSMDSDDSDMADLSRNADEDANEEDQASFNALRKENYSESEGLRKLDSPTDSNERGDKREDEEENKRDMVSSIRSKMAVKRQFR